MLRATVSVLGIFPKRTKKHASCLSASKSTGTHKLADKPTNFQAGKYLLIPSVSSESRHYIPIGFMKPDDLDGNLVFVVPNATLYHFGILTSSIHMT